MQELIHYSFRNRNDYPFIQDVAASASTFCDGTISKKEEVQVVIYHTHTFSAALYKFATPFLNGAILWHHQMSYYAQLMEQNTDGLMDCVWGFIHGTIRKTARKIYHQRSVYTRFKKCHGVKFQSVTVLDSFIHI